MLTELYECYQEWSRVLILTDMIRQGTNICLGSFENPKYHIKNKLHKKCVSSHLQ